MAQGRPCIEPLPSSTCTVKFDCTAHVDFKLIRLFSVEAIELEDVEMMEETEMDDAEMMDVE